MLELISLETPQRKWSSSRLERESPVFTRVAAGALNLRRGPQGRALVASAKASPHASCSGASRDSSPVDAGALYLVWSRCRNLRKPLQCLHGPWGTSGVSQVSQSSFLVDACTCNFLQSCSISVTLPFAWIQESVAFRGGFLTRLCHEAFPRRLPTGLSHMPPCCESSLA